MRSLSLCPRVPAPFFNTFNTQNLPDRMKTKNIRKPLDLPQEIIDIIVHEIASQDLTRKETLKACSLVSKSFCFPCRRHLFSDLELVSDKFSESRAARLLKILQNPDSSTIGLAACVRSLTLTLDVPPSGITHLFMGSKTLGYKLKVMALTLAARLHLYESNVIKALGLLMQAPLESFTLHIQGAIKDWKTQARVARRMETAILMACAAPLTTLHLSNLIYIDEAFIARVLHSNTLKELALTRVTLRDEYADLDLQPTTSQIERLYLKHIKCRQVWRVMGRPILPPLPTPYPFITFSRLRHLIIPSPGTDLEMDAVWQFILGVADTLETLEIEEYIWGDSIHLEQLTSLRSLKIITNALGADSSFNRTLGMICQLLSPAAPSTPVKIQSLIIQFNVEMSPDASPHHALSSPSWLELDDILTSSSYANLRQVDLNLHFCCIAALEVPAGWRPQMNIDPNHVLSRLSTHPSFDFRLNIRNTFTPHLMDGHQYLL